MIDIHSHVLPGLDDGAAGVAEAIQLLRQYAEQGVTTVVCTPHLLPQHLETADTLTAYLDRRDAALAALQAAAEAQNIPVTLLPGAEAMLTTTLLPYLRKRAFSERIALNQGSYLLVELPRMLNGGLRMLEGLLFEIQLTGLMPILAHPERVAHGEGVLPVLRNWVEGGRILLQVNAGHLVDDARLDEERRLRYRARQKITSQMIEQGMVQFIASDAHDPIARPCQGKMVFDEVERAFGSAAANRLMVENPGRAVGSLVIG